MSKFSERLKLLRNNVLISQQYLADIIGISKSSINMYERGEREPSLETLEAIADYFNVDMDYLLGRQEVERKFTLSFDVSTHEVKVISAYHEQPQNQKRVDEILGVESELFSIAKVARGQKELKLTKEQMKEFAESAKKAPNRSQDKDLF